MKTLLITLTLAFVSLNTAHADSGPMMPRNVPQAYTQECAACHTAYPPGLLPAASWNRVMTGLDKHYGTDASLDAATVRQLNCGRPTPLGSRARVLSSLLHSPAP